MDWLTALVIVICVVTVCDTVRSIMGVNSYIRIFHNWNYDPEKKDEENDPSRNT